MTLDYYRRFTDTWLSRAERSDKDAVDEADKFISLWIAFNGWMRGEFGEYEKDRTLVSKVIKCSDMARVFTNLKRDDAEFSTNLGSLGLYKVLDMGKRDDVNCTKQYNGTFESLIRTIYRVRCNLFHGRKTPAEENDFKLICLSYNILIRLFRAYLEKYERRY